MNLRKALSVIFISALVANAALLGACKDDNAGGEAAEPTTEAAPPPSEAAPADHGHEHSDEGMEEESGEGEEADM